MKKKTKNIPSLVSSITPIVKRLVAIKKQAESLGIFIHDRELLECSCGLMEDVSSDGRLFTCRKGDSSYNDTGLFFKKVNRHTFRCPVCKSILKAKFL